MWVVDSLIGVVQCIASLSLPASLALLRALVGIQYQYYWILG